MTKGAKTKETKLENKLSKQMGKANKTREKLEKVRTERANRSFGDSSPS